MVISNFNSLVFSCSAIISESKTVTFGFTTISNRHESSSVLESFPSRGRLHLRRVSSRSIGNQTVASSHFASFSANSAKLCFKVTKISSYFARTSAFASVSVSQARRYILLEFLKGAPRNLFVFARSQTASQSVKRKQYSFFIAECGFRKIIYA